MMIKETVAIEASYLFPKRKWHFSGGVVVRKNRGKGKKFSEIYVKFWAEHGSLIEALEVGDTALVGREFEPGVDG